MRFIPGPSRTLREVDIIKNAFVWAILKDGRDTICHPRHRRENAEEKFLNEGFVVERFDAKKEYHGVGDKPVTTKHCYSFPFNITLGPYQRNLAGVVQSQEFGHEGFVPLLLSLPNQCTMELVKGTGNGLQSATATAPAAYWASWADTMRAFTARVQDFFSNPAQPSIQAAHQAAGTLSANGWNPPTWHDLTNGTSPPRPADLPNEGPTARGWQHKAANVIQT